MKMKTIPTLIALVVTGLLFGGVMFADRPALAADTPATAQSDPMQFARGAKAWADNCARCHNMRDPKELRDDQWRAAMLHMRAFVPV